MPSDCLLLVFVLAAHARVGLLLTLPPGRHDPALHRQMGLSDGTFARSDMRGHLVHTRTVDRFTIFVK